MDSRDRPRPLARTRVLSDTYGLSVGLNRPLERRQLTNPVHVHTDIELNFVFSGSVTYLLGGGLWTLDPERLAVFWAGTPHGLISVAPDTEYAWISVPVSWVLQWHLPNGMKVRMLEGQMLVDAKVPSEDAIEDRLMLRRWLRDFAAEAGASSALLLEVEARLRRMARDPSPAPSQPGAGGVDPAIAALLENAARYISLHYRDPIGVPDIASDLGVHPNYLSQVFKKACGVGLWEYVLRLRVSHAQRLLATTDATILDVSAECGFGSSSQFYESFGRFAGEPPGAYRARVRTT